MRFICNIWKMILIQKLWIFTVFLAVLSDVSAINVNIREETYEVLKGDTTTMTCTFQSRITPEFAIITWSAVGTQPGDPKILIATHYYPAKRTDVNSEYENRVLLLVNVLTGQTKMRLTTVTLADDKIYECRVQIPGDEEGKQADTTRLVVNAIVSTPICGIQGTVREGENINLTCHSEEGSPPPSYKWERWFNSVGFRRRFMDPTTTQNGGVLSLYDISRETSGLYSCVSSNKFRISSCELNLTVLPDVFPQPAYAGVVAGAVAGAVIGTLVSVASAADKLLSDVDNDGGQTPTKSP